MRRRDFVGMGAAATAALMARSAVAQPTTSTPGYPHRPIHLIVPSSAGGVHDVIARIWAGRMAPAMNDLISGQIAVGFVNITAQVVALHRGGKIRILAVNAPARLEALPDIPTTDEAGLPNFVSQTFFGLFGPARTPKAALERIDQATQTAWSDADFRKRLVEAGFEPMLGFGPGKADTYLRQEIARWSPIVQKVGSQTQ